MHNGIILKPGDSGIHKENFVIKQEDYEEKYLDYDDTDTKSKGIEACANNICFTEKNAGKSSSFELSKHSKDLSLDKSEYIYCGMNMWNKPCHISDQGNFQQLYQHMNGNETIQEKWRHNNLFSVPKTSRTCNISCVGKTPDKTHRILLGKEVTGSCKNGTLIKRQEKYQQNEKVNITEEPADVYSFHDDDLTLVSGYSFSTHSVDEQVQHKRKGWNSLDLVCKKGKLESLENMKHGEVSNYENNPDNTNGLADQNGVIFGKMCMCNKKIECTGNEIPTNLQGFPDRKSVQDLTKSLSVIHYGSVSSPVFPGNKQLSSGIVMHFEGLQQHTGTNNVCLNRLEKNSNSNFPVNISCIGEFNHLNTSEHYECVNSFGGDVLDKRNIALLESTNSCTNSLPKFSASYCTLSTYTSSETIRNINKSSLNQSSIHNSTSLQNKIGSISDEKTNFLNQVNSAYDLNLSKFSKTFKDKPDVTLDSKAKSVGNIMKDRTLEKVRTWLEKSDNVFTETVNTDVDIRNTTAEIDNGSSNLYDRSFSFEHMQEYDTKDSCDIVKEELGTLAFHYSVSELGGVNLQTNVPVKPSSVLSNTNITNISAIDAANITAGTAVNNKYYVANESGIPLTRKSLRNKIKFEGLDTFHYSGIKGSTSIATQGCTSIDTQQFLTSSKSSANNAILSVNRESVPKRDNDDNHFYSTGCDYEQLTNGSEKMHNFNVSQITRSRYKYFKHDLKEKCSNKEERGPLHFLLEKSFTMNLSIRIACVYAFSLK